jgi:hypothetical protein
VIADEEHGSLLRDVPEAANLTPKPEAGDEPEERQMFADVVRVPVVEVGR